MNSYKKSIGIILLVVMFCGAPLMSQILVPISELPEIGQLKVLRNGDTIFARRMQQPPYVFNSKKLAKEKNWYSVKDVDYDDIKRIKEEYGSSGYEFEGMQKQKDGKWTLWFSKEKK